jgi:predicted TIM-barrel fold metal-dependent hydrolase
MADWQGKIIDVWAQPPIVDARTKIPEIVRLFEKSGTAANFDRPPDAKQIVSLMDEAGIDKVFLSAWCRPGNWLITNNDVAKFVEAFPDRFIGVATVDLEKPVQAVKELSRAVSDLGFKALRIVPWLWKLPPNDKLYFPLYVRCIELDIPFLTQVGHTGPLMPSETGRPVPYLDEVALTFPELIIVGGHIGHPWTDEMVGLAWKHDNVYIDTSAYLPRYYPPTLIQFLNSYGKHKVLFATNFPQLQFKDCVEQAAQLQIKEGSLKLFLYENARRVFKLHAESPVDRKPVAANQI